MACGFAHRLLLPMLLVREKHIGQKIPYISEHSDGYFDDNFLINTQIGNFLDRFGQHI